MSLLVAQAEYATESLFFYEATTAVAASSASLKTSAKSLINEFIIEGAPQQVNIPSELQKQLSSFNEASSDGHMDEKWLRKLLMKAQAEIYMLMSRDSLPRFVKSGPFQDLLTDMGSYSEVTAALISADSLAQLAQVWAHLYHASMRPCSLTACTSTSSHMLVVTTAFADFARVLRS